MSVKLNKDFLKSVEDRLVKPTVDAIYTNRVVVKEAPRPIVAQEILRPIEKGKEIPLSEKVKDLYNYPDLGKTATPEYSKLEKAVQTIENADSGLSNIAFTAEMIPKIVSTTQKTIPLIGKGIDYARTAAPAIVPYVDAVSGVAAKAVPIIQKTAPFFAKTAPILSTTGKGLSIAAKYAEPVQTILWGADTARTAFDPEYRAQNKGAFNDMYSDTNSGTAMKTASSIGSALARPTSTFQGMMDAYTDSYAKEKRDEFRAAQADRLMRRLFEDSKAERATILGHRSEVQDNRDVPAVNIRNANQQSEQQAARRYFK